MARTSPIEFLTDRLRLEVLRVEHADEMVWVLADDELYEFTGGHAPSRTELADRYRAQIAGPSSANEHWHNWIVRRSDTNDVVGFVQATVVGDQADAAWLIGIEHQGQGFAVEAARAMVRWLTREGSISITAHIHPAHHASAKVADAIGLRPTSEVDSDGEQVWRAPASG